MAGAPCPQKKAVVRGDRCPDCKLADKRRRQRPHFDRGELLRRIATSAPPASTVDGQLRRYKDRQAIEAGEDPFDVDDADLDERPVAPSAAVREKPFKPGTRQPAPVVKTSGESWWTKARPGEMTKTASEHRERMQGSNEAKKVDGGKIHD